MRCCVFLAGAAIGFTRIGSSVIRAARASGAAGTIAVYDSSETVRARVVELGYADEVFADIVEAVRDAIGA